MDLSAPLDPLRILARRKTGSAISPNTIHERDSMSLDWDVTKVKDSDTVCFVERDGESHLSPVTHDLIWLTLGIGIGEITNKTAHEFYTRMRMHWSVYGYTKAERRVTWDDIVAHIGLRTNVFPKESNAKWMKKNIRYIERNHKIEGVS